MKLLRVFSCLLVLPFVVIGCGDDDDFDDDIDEDLDDVVITTTSWEDWTTSTVYPMTDPFEDPYFYDDSTFLTVSQQAPTGDPEAAAVLVADNVELYFSPSGCASIEREGSQVTYTFEECQAPFSENMLDGVLRVTFTDEDDQIGFDVESEDLQIDGLDAEISAQGVYSSAGTTKTVEYSSRRALEGDIRSYTGEFDSTLTWSAGSNCVTRDASGQTTTSSRTFDVTITGYTRCADECPSSGVITMGDSSGTATLTFDGRDRAMFERANGVVEDIELACETPE